MARQPSSPRARYRHTCAVGALLLTVIACFAAAAVVPSTAQAVGCDEARAEYEAAGNWQVVFQTGAPVIDIGGPEDYQGKTRLKAEAGDGACAATVCPGGSLTDPDSCYDDHLYVWNYRDAGTYKITAPGYCTKTYKTSSGSTTFVCLEPAGAGTPTGPGKRRLCNPARGIEPPGCRDVGLTSAPLLDQLGKLGGEALDFLFFDDIRDLQDPKVSDVEKALIIVSYAIPAAKGARITVKLAKGVYKQARKPLVGVLKKGRKAIDEACALPSAIRLSAAAAGNCKQAINALAPDVEQVLKKRVIQNYINKSLLYKTDGKTPIGIPGGGEDVFNRQGGEAAARQLFKDLTQLGERIKQGAESSRIVERLPGDFTATFRPDSASGAVVQVNRRRPPFSLKLHFPG